jgi:hypothetical protein
LRDEVKSLGNLGVGRLFLTKKSRRSEVYGPLTQTTVLEIDTLLKSKKKLSTDELEAFWVDAAAKQSKVPTNPDVITYDQARQLGLTPGEEE